MDDVAIVRIRVGDRKKVELEVWARRSVVRGCDSACSRRNGRRTIADVDDGTDMKGPSSLRAEVKYGLVSTSPFVICVVVVSSRIVFGMIVRRAACWTKQR